MSVYTPKSFKEDRLESCIRVKPKTIEGRIDIVNVSVLTRHIIQCLLLTPDSESMYIVSAEIATNCSLTFCTHYFFNWFL